MVVVPIPLPTSTVLLRKQEPRVAGATLMALGSCVRRNTPFLFRRDNQGDRGMGICGFPRRRCATGIPPEATLCGLIRIGQWRDVPGETISGTTFGMRPRRYRLRPYHLILA